MKKRIFGKTGWEVSEVSLGTWQVGGRWGEPFDEKNAERILEASLDTGVNFIDTADVYSDGLSERVVGKIVKKRSEWIYVASKCGRRLSPHTTEGYNEANITRFVEDSLRNSGLDVIDLIQLHCPPTPVYSNPDVFAAMEKLREQGKIRAYGVSVEKVEEALKAIEYPGVVSVQIIFNMFRLKPAEQFFEAAKAANVAILARVPLASGLLTGKMHTESSFGKADHRFFNREGQAFDKGETFSGVPFASGLEAVEDLKIIFGKENLTLEALKWTLMFDAVTCVIPGASSPEQAINNIKASALPDFTPSQMNAVREVYDRFFREQIHHCGNQR